MVSAKDFRGRDVLALQDFSAEEIRFLLDQAAHWKKKRFGNELRNKTVLLLFSKPSTRTKISFAVATHHLGGSVVTMDQMTSHLGHGETLKDTAYVLSRYVDAIVARLFAQQDLVDLAQYASVPVLNALTDSLHPCQALADYLTIREKKGTFHGLNVAYVGDGNNVCHSLLIAGSKLGVNVSVASPRGYAPDAAIVKQAKENAQPSGSFIRVVQKPLDAVKGADVVYTDTWTSMGREKEAAKRKRMFRPYQVNQKLLSAAKHDALVMHCMPVHRGLELTDDVMDGPQSVLIDQAENRLHTEKALLALVLG
ncbi:MAG: ornithine carbamoyltransferase [Nanoarchaeota archaeon]|nr:ornithine carbamoyltransferase [Nanoarchaeota archaeon]